MKNLIASLTLICCAGVAMAISAAPGDGDKKAECEAAKAKAAQVAQVASECQGAKAQAVAQVKSSECQAAKAAQVAQVVSTNQECCAAARKAQAVAQVKSSECQASKTVAQVVSSECQASKAVAQVVSTNQECCAAAKAQAVAQVKSSECQASKVVAQVVSSECQAAKGVAQVASSSQECCAAASKAKGVAQVVSSECQAATAAQVAQVTGAADASQCSKTAEVKYITYGCEISDRLARTAAASYISFMKELQCVTGAEGCCLSASVKTLEALYSDEKTDPCFGCETSDRLAKSVAVGYVKFMGELKSIAGYEGCAYDASMKTLAAVIDDTVAEAQASAKIAEGETAVFSVREEASASKKGCGADCAKACCNS